MYGSIGEFAGMPLITDYPTSGGTSAPTPQHEVVFRASRFDPNSGVIEEYRNFPSIQETVTFAMVENSKQRNVGYSPIWQVSILDDTDGSEWALVPMSNPWCP